MKIYPTFADEQYRFWDRVGEGVKKSQNLVDVINGSPLSVSHISSPDASIGVGGERREDREERFLIAAQSL